MVEKRSKHSKKPNFIRDLIKDWFPSGDRLEMFCREGKQGWDTWGNEVEDSIDLSEYYT